MRKKTSIRPIVGIVAVALLLVFSAPAMAQMPDLGQQPEIEQVTDDELNRFVTALQLVEEIQIETQATMSEAIEARGMSEQRFSEIHSVQQNPEMDLGDDISDAEEEAYEVVLAELIEVQQSAQQDMQSAVAGEGFDVQRFNEIIMAIQQDPQLAQQVQEMLQ